MMLSCVYFTVSVASWKGHPVDCHGRDSYVDAQLGLLFTEMYGCRAGGG